MRDRSKPSSSNVWLLLLGLLVLGAVGAAVSMLLADPPHAPVPVPSVAREAPTPAADPTMKLLVPDRVEEAPQALSLPVGSGRPDDTPMLAVEDGTPRGRITGVVIDSSQQPVPGAQLTIFRGNPLINANFPGMRQKVDASATSDAQGAFELHGVPAGKDYVLVAEHADYAPGEQPSLRVTAEQELGGVVITLTAGATVSGQVLTVGESPIRGARVELYDSMANAALRPEERRPWKIVLTDNLGQFSFEHVSATNLRVRVEAEAYESQIQGLSYALEARPKNEVLIFRLNPGHSLHGRVVDMSGRAVPGARLEATSLTKDYQGNVIGVADETGYFILDGMGEVPYQLRCTAAGYSDAVRPKVMVSGGELLIEMERRMSVTGWVRTGSGEPVRSFSLALMRAIPGRDSALMNDVRTFSSQDGSFEFDNLDPGSYAFEARAKDMAPAHSEAVTIARDGVPPQPLQIVVTPGATLRGRVVDSAGAPVKRALVKVNANNHLESHLLQIFQQVSPGTERKVQTRTQNDGSFVIRNITPGTYQVRVEHEAWAPLTHNDVTLYDDGVATNASLELRMPQGATIGGRVFDPRRQPMSFTEVQIGSTDNTGWSDIVTTDRDGYYVFENLVQGTYSLSVRPKADLKTGEPINPLLMLLHSQKSKREVFVNVGQAILDFDLQVVDNN